MPGSLLWNVAGVSWSRNRFCASQSDAANGGHGVTALTFPAAAMFAHCENRERDCYTLQRHKTVFFTVNFVRFLCFL